MEIILSFKSSLLHEKPQPSNATVKNYLADVRKFVKWFEETFNESFNPQLVSPEVVKAYKALVLASPRSGKRYLSSLKKFFAHLVANGTMQTNPFSIVLEQKPIVVDPWKLREFKNFLIFSNASTITIKNYLHDLKHFFMWLESVSTDNTTGTVAFSNLTTQVINEYKDRLLFEAKFSPNSINRKLSSLKKYTTWAIAQHYLQTQLSIQQIAPTPKTLVTPVRETQRPEFITQKIQPLSAFAGQELGEAPKHREKRFSYSQFASIRFFQKTKKLIVTTTDLLLLTPIVKTLGLVKYHLWQANGAPIFVPLEQLITGQTTTPLFVASQAAPIVAANVPLDAQLLQKPQVTPEGILKLPKSFYAPLKMATGNMPIIQKIIYHLRFTRPRWYKKYHAYPIVHYVHFGIALIVACVLGFKIYDTITNSPYQGAPILSAVADSPSRLLKFQGTLTDESNTPITTGKPVRFVLYSSPVGSGSALLWQETQEVNPNQNGSFEAILGDNTPLTQDLITDNPNLYLGISIGSDNELKPRQQIATVSYARTAETVQGMLPITDPRAKAENVILALDSSGDLTIDGAASPTFAATGGEFTLSGQTLTLSTVPGSNGNVQIIPDGTGMVDIQKPIQNTSNYTMTPGMEGAVAINDSLDVVASNNVGSAFALNQNGSGNLISASRSGVAKFSLDGNGNGFFAGDIRTNGNDLTTNSLTFNLLNRNVINLNIGGSATNVSIGATSGTTKINNSLNVQDRSIFEGGLNIASGERLGVGTLSPEFAFDTVADEGQKVIASIFNKNTSNTADGLRIKLGNTEKTVSTGNHFLDFETAGAGIVGSIQGNNANGIQIIQNSIADWAEYFPKDPMTALPFGSLVCLADNGLAVGCDKDHASIIGVASRNPTLIAGANRGNSSVPVGLVGLVKTLVSTENGEIKAGDMIGISATSGIGSKATRPGFVVGRALESLPCATGTSCQAEVLVSLQITWYQAQLALTPGGDVIEQNDTQNFASMIADLQTGLADIKQTIRLGSPAASEAATLAIAPAATPSAEQIATGLDIALATTSASTLASTSATASPSATQTVTPTQTPTPADGSPSLPTTPLPKFEILNSQEKYASIAAELTPVINANFGKFNEGIVARGASSLSNTTIDGQLTVGSSLLIAENSINTIGTDLELQPLRQGNLSIMGGLVAIDTEGNINVSGNANFAKDVTVKGKLTASLIAPVPNENLVVKLGQEGQQNSNTSLSVNNADDASVLAVNQTGDVTASGTGKFKNLSADAFKIIRGAEANTSRTESVVNGSAGSTILTAFETERTIVTQYVTRDSLIYISPVSDTQGATPYIARQKPTVGSNKGSFTIQIPSRVNKDIKINWWIVN